MKKSSIQYYYLKIMLVLMLTLLVVSRVDSQSYEHTLDSLLSGKTVEEQLEALQKQYYKFRYVNLSFAESLCDTALDIALETKDTSLIARALFDKGTICYLKEHYDSAAVFYKRSISKFESICDSISFLEVYRNLSVVYTEILHLEKSQELLTRGLQISRMINDTANIIDYYKSLGNVFYYYGMYTRTLKYYDSAQYLNSIFSIPGDDYFLKINIGAIYETQNKFELALENYNYSLHILDSLKFYADKALVLRNIGAVYLQTGENMKALDVLFESLYLRDSLDLEAAQASTLILIGKAYEFEGNLQRANEMYMQGLKILQKHNDMRQVAHALTYIGKNLQMQNQHESALAYYRTGLAVAKESRLNLEISECYKHLVLLFGETREEDSTLKYLDLYADVKQKLSIDFEEISDEGVGISLGQEIEGDVTGNGGNQNGKPNEILLINWIFAIIIVSGLVLFIFVLLAIMMINKKRRSGKFHQ